MPENSSDWQALQEKCRLQVRAWYVEEMNGDPYKMPPRSAFLSFHAQTWWQSVSRDGQVFSNTMDKAGNLKHSRNEETGEYSSPAEQ
jgi:hypothetical protein